METKKRKVQFSGTKKVKKFVKGDYEDGSDLERSDEEVDSKEKIKHTLDSDEEDDSGKFKLLNQECLHDIGQEAKTKEFDGEIKLTAFNMKDELDDGNFDTDGFYHWKSKDKDDIKDAWLDNIEWANVNSFKDKYSLDKAEEEKFDSENEEKVDLLSDNESVSSKEGEMEFFKKILNCLKPGETVLKAIKRLGAVSNQRQTNTTASRAGLSASQRWLKKKTPVSQNQNTVEDDIRNSDQIKTNMETLEALTEYANHFIDRGYYDIYEETYEKLNYKINNSDQTKKDEAEYDMFADELNDIPRTSGNNENLVEDTIVKWVYKTENSDVAKIQGPYTSLQMLEKSEKGEFKDSGVWCRKLEEASNVAFYNSKRIDFELYT